MNKKIEISEDTYLKLSELAVGFDTPESVIRKLIADAHGSPEAKPSLMFYPDKESTFKEELLRYKEAEVVIYLKDSKREITHWKANKFSESSNLRGNIWSGPLRGWKGKGIDRAEFSIMPQATSGSDGDDVMLNKAIALELQLTYDEIESLNYEVGEDTSNDGCLYGHIIDISNANPPELLTKIKNLHGSLTVNIGKV